MNEQNKPDEVVKPLIEKYHCVNCRKDLSADQAMKMPLDYFRKEDGTLEAYPARFSVFCKTCNHFIGVMDPQREAELQKIVNKK
jgi:hypothetical protein